MAYLFLFRQPHGKSSHLLLFRREVQNQRQGLLAPTDRAIERKQASRNRRQKEKRSALELHVCILYTIPLYFLQPTRSQRDVHVHVHVHVRTVLTLCPKRCTCMCICDVRCFNARCVNNKHDTIQSAVQLRLQIFIKI